MAANLLTKIAENQMGTGLTGLRKRFLGGFRNFSLSKKRGEKLEYYNLDSDRNTEYEDFKVFKLLFTKSIKITQKQKKIMNAMLITLILM